MAAFSTAVTAALMFGSGAVALLVSIFVFEIFAAVSWPLSVTPAPRSSSEAGRVVVLIPAHNESHAIEATLGDVKLQLRSQDEILVVADNCTDDTALIAQAAGATVIERHDPVQRGKGYALEFGIRYLAKDPPECLIVIDSDCRLGANAVSILASMCASSGRPVQALDLMVTPLHSQTDHRLSEFAWRVKNWIRPMGMASLGLPCQLMGTGMAFPWLTVQAVNMGSGHLAEDLKLGLDLAARGHPPLFCPAALVTSEFPCAQEAAVIQRQRWEGGHLTMIFTAALPLMAKAVVERNRDLFVLAADMAVPPLTLLAFANAAVFLGALIAFAAGLSPVPLVISCLSVLFFLLATHLCWHKYGPTVAPLGALMRFFSAKMRVYVALALRRAPREWTRTDRRR